MQVSELSVERKASYDSEYPNMLVGMVTLKGPNGEQKIRLSNGALSRIFNVIAQEVCGTAARNAADVGRGMQNATDEPLMLESQTIGALSHD